eukprot:gene6852-7573_t
MSTFHLASDIALGNGALGGSILAIACISLMYLSAKVTGISGISAGLVQEEGEDWNFSYIAGLLLAGFILGNFYPGAFGETLPYSFPVIILGGILVGFGTRLSSGCTSGHGLMGLSRFSPRSLVAVMTFMGFGGLTASIVASPSVFPYLTDANHLLKALETTLPYPLQLIPTIVVVASTIIIHRSNRLEKGIADTSISMKASSGVSGKLVAAVRDGWFRQGSTPCLNFISFVSALVFGLGLGVSGMTNPNRVSGFLAPFRSEGWDPSLMAVMGSGVVILAVAWQFIKRNHVVSVCGNKIVGDNLQIGLTPANLKIDARLVVGAALFGIGWGLCGICPGPAWVSLGASIGGAGFALFIPAMLVGMLLKDIIAK